MKRADHLARLFHFRPTPQQARFWSSGQEWTGRAPFLSSGYLVLPAPLLTAELPLHS